MNSQKEKITKDSLPEDFTYGLVAVDLIPVIFFGLNATMLGMLFDSALFVIGAILCFLAGLGKVFWKLLVVMIRRNIWFWFVQMRVVMPIGFALMLLGMIVDHSSISLGIFLSFPSWLFFVIGFAGMGLMGYFAKHLDSADAKSNWIEQLTNGASQIAIFIGLQLLL